MDRRIFLKTSSLASAAMLAPISSFSNTWYKQRLENIGVQIYSVRNELNTDFAGTIKSLADIGFTYLELFNYKEGKIYNNSVKDINRILSSNNLKATSSHIKTGAKNPNQDATMINNWEKAVADGAEMGLKYMVCAHLDEPERQHIDDYKRLADLFNKSAEVCKQYGIQFAYHNHDFEFIPLNNEVPYDILLAQTDKDLVKMELDLYWITKVGKDPIEYFKKHPGRFPLWHVKDMSKNKEQYFTEVGNGSIDWKRIFEHTETAGMKKFFVEQDVCRDFTPLESLKISYNYLKKLEF